MLTDTPDALASAKEFRVEVKNAGDELLFTIVSHVTDSRAGR